MSSTASEVQAGLGIGALELFVEVLSQSDETAAADGFYDRLCEAVCRLASMRRAVIFRYDSADRRVRAAGAHGMSIAPFADAHVTVESAPIAAQALREDRVVEIVGDLTGQAPGQFAAIVSEPARLVWRADGGARADDRRDPRRPPDVAAAVAGGRSPAAVDAGQGPRRSPPSPARSRPSSSVRPRSNSGSTSPARSTTM